MKIFGNPLKDIFDRRYLYQELVDAYGATLEGWATALELIGKETKGHCRRVVNLTLELAKKLEIDEDQLQWIHYGALLHDIGKMGVPEGILHKPGPLTPEERKIVEKHPGYAYDLLKDIEYLGKAMPIPYSHHEKWDGTGYPLGLKGEEIPLQARIFAVVDVWDALTRDQPYRKAWTREDAITFLEDQAGYHFDPRIVDVFLQGELVTDYI